jgi:phosphoribosylamine--glycine ligase
MRILLVGGGGREHALARAIAASPLCTRLFAAPGNPGIATVAQCVPIAADDVEKLAAFAAAEAIDFVMVGPEGPLVAGLVDRLEAAGIAACGPRAAAAILEGSKGFMKDLCARHGIPTARYRRFTDAAEAKSYVRAEGAPIVVKADRLAAGKGVVVAATVGEAEAAVDALLARPDAAIVVEESLGGPEISFFALCDGATVLPLGTARDHKRAFDGDRGPNTGGMGALSPHPLATPCLEARIMAEIVRPTLAAMAAEGRPFRGMLFAGLMLTADGPKLLEYNVRFGDPETQALIPRLDVDLLPLLLAVAHGTLDRHEVRWRPETAVAVVLATRGYPGPYTRGSAIRGIAAAEAAGTIVYHAGTRQDADGTLRAEGGRVLAITALGQSAADARDRAYKAAAEIAWPEGFRRTDIGA